jgi:RNA polymerase subunit RPABC4/transcription elongation factor Spt4
VGNYGSGPLQNTTDTVQSSCTKCGALLTVDQEFCPKCGQPRSKMNVCGKCGAALQDGQEFCPKCGQKVGLAVDSNVSFAISQFNAGVEKEKSKKKKTPIILGVLVIILVLGAIAFKKIAPKIFIDTAGYIEQGDYEKAYAKAKTDEDKQLVVDAYLSDGKYKEAYDIALSDQDKLQIQIENAAAVYGQYSADNLKDPSSFVLRDAYYYEGEKGEDGKISKRLVLQISGNNSYGASVSNYWLYTWEYDKNKFSYFC